jgi:hypothetical protein
MTYLDHEATVIYPGKDGKDQKIFPALEWLAAMCSHIPNKGEQMVRYYGYYRNVSRGKRQKEGSDNVVPCILESQGDDKQPHITPVIYLPSPAVPLKYKHFGF